jgi:hypothetical protein
VKCLVTGWTPQQGGRLPDLGYMTLTDCVIKLLRDLGHEVDARNVKPEEDLSEYGLIICGICSPFSVSGRHIYGGLSLMDRYWITGKIPVMSLVDDWEMHQIDQNSRSAKRGMYRLTRESVYAHRPGYDWALSAGGQAAMTRVIDRVTETGYPPAIFPAFGWGNHEVFQRMVTAESYHCLDLTCYTPVYPVTRTWPSERRKEWILGVIKHHGPFLDTIKNHRWPVREIGGGMTKRDKSSLMQERDLVALYGGSWGILSPFYGRLAGSGWWRNRFVYAAMARTVLYCNPREAPQLGEAYMLPISTIESFTPGQLTDVAEAQAAALRAGCWSGVQLHEAGMKMVAEVTGH